MKKPILLYVCIFMLSACNKSEPVQTVDWYKEHSKERQAMLDKCNQNPGELRNTPNCINAGTAETAVVFSSDSNYGPTIKPLDFRKKKDEKNN